MLAIHFPLMVAIYFIKLLVFYLISFFVGCIILGCPISQSLQVNLATATIITQL